MKTNLLPYQKLDLIQGSEEWKAERLKHCTASNVASLFDLSPYKTKLQYFEELLTGIEPKISDATQILFEVGHSAESDGRKYVEKTYGYSFPATVVVSTSCPDLLASLDGFNEEHGDIFEAKYVGAETIRKIREAQVRDTVWIPAHHEVQVQAQLLATGAKRCIYFALDPQGEAAVVEILRNEDYIADIARTVTEFMRDVREGRAPEPSERDYHTPNDERFLTLAELKRKADEADAAFKAAKDLLIEEYKDYGRIRAGGVLVIRSYVTGSVDYSKIPQLKSVDLSKYRKPGRFQVAVRLEKKGVA